MIRWLWQYRVPLVPVWVVLATLTGGLVARFVLTELPTWQIGALAALVLLPVAAWAWRIRRAWRRRWVLALTLATGAVMTWMHGTGVDDVLMVFVAHIVLGVAIAVGRILNAPLGEKVDMEGELRDWPERAQRIGYPLTRWTNTKLIPGQGWTARLEWDPGAYDRDQVRKDVHRFEGARDLPVGSLRLLPRGRNRNSLDAIFLRDDPNTATIEWPGPAKHENYSAHDPVPLGLTPDKSTVGVVRFREGKGERRILLGGASESGKSGFINNFVGEDACRDDVVGLGMDLKQGVELGPWERVLLWMVSDIPGAMEMLAALEAAIVYRGNHMRERKVRVWPLSPELPAIHVTVDEIRKLAGSQTGRTGKQQRLLLDRLIDVATQGRAMGIGLLAAGQLLTLEALGTSQVRSQFDIRIGLRMNEKDSAAYVFPDNPEVRLHEIPAELPGTAYVKDGEKMHPSPIRGYYWTDELVDQVAELREGGGAMLDKGTGDAMAAASPMFAEIWARVQGGESASVPAGEAGNDGDASGDSPVDEAPVDLGKAPVPTVFDGDADLAEVVRRNRERTTPPGAAAPVPLRPKPRERLTDDEAKVEMRRMLREAGPQGCSARDLYRAATRGSTWFHEVINEWIDEEGSVVRNGHGRYADARALAGASRTAGHHE